MTRGRTFANSYLYVYVHIWYIYIHLHIYIYYIIVMMMILYIYYIRSSKQQLGISYCHVWLEGTGFKRVWKIPIRMGGPTKSVLLWISRCSMGLQENLPETMVFTTKIWQILQAGSYGFPADLLVQSHEVDMILHISKHSQIHIEVSINRKSPIAGWFIRENPWKSQSKMDDVGVPPFQETS